MNVFNMDRLRQTIILTLIFTLVLSLPALLAFTIPEANKTFMNILIGWFIAKGSDAVGFLLNSTDRSQAKDAALNALATAAGAGTTTTTTTMAAGPPVVTTSPTTDASGDPAPDPATPAPGTATVTVAAPASLDIKETTDAPQPDASPVADAASGAPQQAKPARE